MSIAYVSSVLHKAPGFGRIFLDDMHTCGASAVSLWPPSVIRDSDKVECFQRYHISDSFSLSKQSFTQSKVINNNPRGIPVRFACQDTR